MVFSSLKIEQILWSEGKKFIAGVDEVGRGCFAGPVVTAAVIFSPDVVLPVGIADSKLLSPKKRVELDSQIKDLAVCWAIGEVGLEEINKVGIGKATQICFQKSVTSLKLEPDFILIDAFFIEGIERQKQKAIIHGDQISSSIAAASIIAKVYRDQLMETLAVQYPGYGFEAHKGYGTKAHRDAIKQLGLCELHRKSFDLNKFC